jgi:hypothetical protein
MAAPFRDYGAASFSSSGGARNAVAFANPLSPGGMSPKGVHLPTLGWVVVFGVVAFGVYHYWLKK